MKPILHPLCAILLPATLIGAPSPDVPQWRGPNRDGIFPANHLLQAWPVEGPKLVWKSERIGRGMAGVSIVKDRIYTVGGRDGAQHLIALDLNTHEEAWAAPLSRQDGEPRCTPTVSDGLVFAVSTEGDLVCVRATDGGEVWRLTYAERFGVQGKPTWQFSESPLVDGDRLIVVPGGDKAILAALDKKTGATIWTTEAELKGKGHGGAGYTGAVISSAGGVRQYVTLVGKGAVGVEAKTGKLLWHYNRVANGTAVIPTPLVWEDYVFVSSGYGTGAALLKIKKRDSAADDEEALPGSPLVAHEEYWLNASQFQNHHGGMVRIGDFIYAGKGHNNGLPICLNWKTGKPAWEQDRGPGKESAAVIAADGNLYFRYQDGVMALIEATPEGYREKGTFRLASDNGPSWPHPTIHDGLLYVRDQHVLLCYDLRDR